MKTNQKMTTLDIVRVTIEELGYEYSQQRGWINTKDKYNHNDPITLMAVKVRHALEQAGSDRVPATKTIIESLDLLQANCQKQFAEKCYELVKFNPTATDTAEELSRLLSGNNYHELYPHIWRQWIFTVKNRLLGKVVRCPIFPILYGGPGLGKSTGIKKFYSSLPPHKCNLVKDGQKVVDSEKHMQMLFDNLVIHLEEMAGMDKASLEKLKTILDMSFGAYVPLYTNATKQGFVTATFIGSTNTAVKNLLVSSDLNRKWVQVNFYEPPTEGRETFVQTRIKAIEDFNYLNLWQSVDESGSEPLSDPQVYERYLKYLEETCRSNTPTTEFIQQIKDARADDWISRKELCKEYKAYMQEHHRTSKPQSPDLFYETCEKHGLKPRREPGVGTRGFDIPEIKPSDTLNIGDMV